MNVISGKSLSSQTFSFDSLQMNSADEIIFSIGESEIGYALVARSNIGICGILIGLDADELRNDLSSRFPRSTLVQNDETLRGDLEKVMRFLGTPNEGLDLLPLDPRGTHFQRRVWDALLTVQVGAVITYAALARRIGEPNAVRAVASACASNPLALAIPGHRVVRMNGAVGGCRGESSANAS